MAVSRGSASSTALAPARRTRRGAVHPALHPEPVPRVVSGRIASASTRRRRAIPPRSPRRCAASAVSRVSRARLVPPTTARFARERSRRARTFRDVRRVRGRASACTSSRARIVVVIIVVVVVAIPLTPASVPRPAQVHAFAPPPRKSLSSRSIISHAAAQARRRGREGDGRDAEGRPHDRDHGLAREGHHLRQERASRAARVPSPPSSRGLLGRMRPPSPALCLSDPKP